MRGPRSGPEQALAADADDLTAHSGTCALRQPGDGLRDVDRLTTLAEAVDPAADLTGGQRDPGSHLGLDEAGRHRVDGDAPGGGPRRLRPGLHHAGAT